MKNKKSILNHVIGAVISIIFFLIFLRFTGLYDIFIDTIKYLPDFIKDITHSLKEGAK